MPFDIIPVLLVVFPLLILYVHRFHSPEAKMWKARGFKKIPNRVTRQYYRYLDKGMEPDKARQLAQDSTMGAHFLIWVVTIVVVCMMVVANFATFPLGLLALIFVKYINGADRIIAGETSQVQNPER